MERCWTTSLFLPFPGCWPHCRVLERLCRSCQSYLPTDARTFRPPAYSWSLFPFHSEALLLSLWLYLLLQGDFQVLQEVRATTTVAFQQPLTDKYFEAYSIPFSKTGRPLQAKKELQANPWFLVYMPGDSVVAQTPGTFGGWVGVKLCAYRLSCLRDK